MLLPAVILEIRDAEDGAESPEYAVTWSGDKCVFPADVVNRVLARFRTVLGAANLQNDGRKQHRTVVAIDLFADFVRDSLLLQDLAPDSLTVTV
jgi:hypothetical protein